MLRQVEALAPAERQFDGSLQTEPKRGLVSPELRQRRTLTEFENLLAAMDTDGNVPPTVEQDVKTNLRTAVSEIAMPYAVTTTHHRVGYEMVAGQRQRVITWLGKNAVQNALNGKLYHSHPAALERVAVEVEEAQDAERSLRKGYAKIFISPKMSASDAPLKIAQAEHLGDEDSVRVSKAITSTNDEVVARELQSLLVADIPLDAWYAWLKSPHNLLGKSFYFSDERSALPIMKLFREMEVPEDKVPEGPVSVLVGVLPHIRDLALRQKLNERVEKYRKDQALYSKQATETADRWYDFDLELARSFKFEQVTPQIKYFIASLEGQWDDAANAILVRHQKRDGSFHITRDVVEILEYAQQNILNSEAGAVTGNEKLLKQVDGRTATALMEKIAVLKDLRATGAPPEILMAFGGDLNRFIADQNFKVGGGCPGENTGNFKKNKFENSLSRTIAGDSFEIPESFEILKCVKCPLCNKEGVDATIEHYDGKKVITCSSCKQSKEYENA